MAEVRTIEVKQDHIDRGLRHSSQCCPVALALHDAGYTEASVLTSSITWRTSPGIEAVAVTPPKARQFMHDFDNQLEVAPFKFRMRRAP